MFKFCGLVLSSAVLCEAIARQEPEGQVHAEGQTHAEGETHTEAAPAEAEAAAAPAEAAPAQENHDVDIGNIDNRGTVEIVDGPTPAQEAAERHQEEETRVVHKSGGKCKPLCNWECDNPVCNEVCTPQCAAPTCKTFCKPVIKESCTVECGEPDCTVICPRACTGSDECKCQTVCKQPQCQTTCQQECLSTCAEPLCTWNCNKPDGFDACPKPKCKMACSTCNDDFHIPSPEVTPWGGKDAVLQKVGQAKVGNGSQLVHVEQKEGESFFQLPDRYAHHAAEYSL